MNLGLLSRALTVAASVMAGALFAAACGETAAETQASSSSGAGAGSSGTGAGASSATSGAGGSTPNPLAPDCAILCEWVDQIGCSAWKNCETECPAGLGASADCRDEFGTLLSCWVANKSNFACTPTQILPPFACQPEEQSLQECALGETGGVDSGCAGQVCNHTDDKCSCATSCNDSEYKSSCSAQGSAYSCSCYDGQKLLGTCVQELTKCDNYEGCCAPFFQAP